MLFRSIEYQRCGRDLERDVQAAKDELVVAQQKLLQPIAKKLEETGKFPGVSTVSSEGRMRLFKREYSRIKKEKTITGDAAVAMRKALGFEAEGREMYTRMAAHSSNRQEKAFFKILASEEQKHFDIIYEYLEFLDTSGLRMGE